VANVTSSRARIDGGQLNEASHPNDWSLWERTPCPVCGQAETLEQLKAEQKPWWDEARDKNGGMSPDRQLDLQANDPQGGVGWSSLSFYFERCTSCGSLYDPYVKVRAAITRTNTRKLKDYVLHPLERLAEEAP